MHRIILIVPGLVGGLSGEKEQGWLIQINGVVQSALVEKPTLQDVERVAKAEERSQRKQYKRPDK